MDERPSYDDEGNYIYYASELGSCTKNLVAKRMGYIPKTGADLEPGGRLQLLFAEGNLHEEAVIKRLQQEGWVLRDFQKEVKLHVGVPGTIIMGHLDATGYPIKSGTHGVVEVKSMGDESFKEFKRLLWDTPGLIQKYKWQVSVYCWAEEKPGWLVAKNRNTGEQLIVPIPTGGFYTYDELQRRVLEVEASADAGVLPDDCDYPNFPCPFEYLHTQDREFRTDVEIDIWAREYKRAQVNAKIEAAKMTECRAKIEQALETAHTKTLETIGGTRITRYHVRGKKSYDYGRMADWFRNHSDKAWGEFMLRQFEASGEDGYDALRISIKGDED